MLDGEGTDEEERNMQIKFLSIPEGKNSPSRNEAYMGIENGNTPSSGANYTRCGSGRLKALEIVYLAKWGASVDGLADRNMDADEKAGR